MESKTDILNELKALSPKLASIEKRNVFTVPEGYFNQLSDDVMQGIHIEEGRLVQPELAGADVPAGYFDSLADSILNKIKTHDADDALSEIKTLSPMLANIRHLAVYEIPPGYFEGLPDKIVSGITEDDAQVELRALSPMLYSIQGENVFEVPAGYFENLGRELIERAKPKSKVVTMNRRSTTFFKYMVAAAFTGLMALGVFKFVKPDDGNVLPDYVTMGMQIKDLGAEFDKLSNEDIVSYLEANGTDVKAALVANSVDKNELPLQEDYLFDEKALDNYLNSINLDALKN